MKKSQKMFQAVHYSFIAMGYRVVTRGCKANSFRITASRDKTPTSITLELEQFNRNESVWRMKVPNDHDTLICIQKNEFFHVLQQLQCSVVHAVFFGNLKATTMKKIQMRKRNRATDQDLFEDIYFVVRANSNEIHNLWERFAKDSELCRYEDDIQYQQVHMGHTVTVGYSNVDGKRMPIAVEVWFSKVYGKKIMYYSPCSAFYDLKRVERWLERHLPQVRKNLGDRQVTTNAMNFGNCLQAVKHKAIKEELLKG